MPEQPARVLLLGRWSRAVTDELARHLVLVPHGDPHEPPVVDWVLVRVAPVVPVSAVVPVHGSRTTTGAAQVSAVRNLSPGARLAVIDPAGHWDGSEACDVYLGGDDVRPEELLAALSLAGRGFRVLGQARSQSSRSDPYEGSDDPAAVRLTVRERELLEALCAGLGNVQIAQKLRISRSTVEFHLTKIFRKLGVSSRAEAIVWVMRPDRPPLSALPRS